MQGEVAGNAANEVLAARLLGEAGYRTGLSGKWHLGEQAGSFPTDMGFERFFGMLGVVDMYQDWQMSAYSPEITSKPERFAAYKAFHERGDWLMQGVAGKPLERVKPMTLDTTANMDQDFAAWSENFIREASADGKPFYLVHSFSKVHFFNIPAQGYAGRSPAGTPYRDGVVEVDDIVGRLLKTLKDTGQLENTFVFFTSDNGPEEDSWPDTGHTPFRGAKGTTWEGGVRVPGIAYWPGMIAPGRRSDGLFDLMDLFNTSLALAGAAERIPDDRYIDGIDQSSFLLADDGQSRREIVWMWNQDEFAAMRVQEFKGHYRLYEVDNNNPDALGGLNNSRAITPMNPWFYNLYNDPKERVPKLVEKVWAAGMMNFPLFQHAMTLPRVPEPAGAGDAAVDARHDEERMSAEDARPRRRGAARAARAPLSVEDFVAATLELVDTHGIEAVSMRRVAAHLGVSPMAAYRHFRDKEDLLVHALDAFAGRAELLPQRTVGLGRVGARSRARDARCAGRAPGMDPAAGLAAPRQARRIADARLRRAPGRRGLHAGARAARVVRREPDRDRRGVHGRPAGPARGGCAGARRFRPARRGACGARNGGGTAPDRPGGATGHRHGLHHRGVDGVAGTLLSKRVRDAGTRAVLPG